MFLKDAFRIQLESSPSSDGEYAATFSPREKDLRYRLRHFSSSINRKYCDSISFKSLPKTAVKSFIRSVAE
jgi:hypothetical protein